MGKGVGSTRQKALFFLVKSSGKMRACVKACVSGGEEGLRRWKTLRRIGGSARLTPGSRVRAFRAGTPRGEPPLYVQWGGSPGLFLAPARNPAGPTRCAAAGASSLLRRAWTLAAEMVAALECRDEHKAAAMDEECRGNRSSGWSETPILRERHPSGPPNRPCAVGIFAISGAAAMSVERDGNTLVREVRRGNTAPCWQARTTVLGLRQAPALS
ncbi:uncharacterized protein LOC134474162 [Cavia porcellus]|uniref:uncharacterized protein LOC134474162 n=1 Tax=Cavia porcellus TaxID=10141 RepID=UPI002FE3F681